MLIASSTFLWDRQCACTLYGELNCMQCFKLQQVLGLFCRTLGTFVVT